MVWRKLLVAVGVTALVGACWAQGFSRWNFNIGGGFGVPLSTTSDFAGTGGNFVVGGGPNISRIFGVDGEFMWQGLPIKQNVINAIGVPDAHAREYSVTGNLIIHIPTGKRFAPYLIGGGGWYHRSGEATAPALVPGTVCPPFWVWWGTCVSGLWPGNVVIASSSSNAFGGNVGGGLTFRIGESHLKFYSEVRYHHASHDHVDTDVLPVTFGLRW